MESRKNKETKVNSLPDNDKESLHLIVDRIKALKDKEPSEISESSLESLESIILDLLVMQNRHQRLFRRWLKQGYLAD
jgi:hypothetical protein|tara:strand:- start:2137 stop:2370 length:234 start_codon:yes stop_codon:yes gene_type:complete